MRKAVGDSRPGFKTTEFWLVLFAAIAPVAVEAIPDEFTPILVIVYAVCRTVVKAVEGRKG